ncbi:MAG: DUF7424 family protein [Alcaligenes sp.]
MRMFKVGTMALLALLVACKATVSTEIKFSELAGANSKMLPGELTVEVSACNHYEDSRQPSASVLEAQQAIPGIFKDAKYVECYKQRMNSYARFELPVALDKGGDEKLFSDEHINFRSHEGMLLGLFIPTQIKARIKSATKGKLAASALVLNFSLKVTNDLSEDQDFWAYSVFVDGQASVANRLSIPKGKTMTLNLSDVSVQEAIQRDYALVLGKVVK